MKLRVLYFSIWMHTSQTTPIMSIIYWRPIYQQLSELHSTFDHSRQCSSNLYYSGTIHRYKHQVRELQRFVIGRLL